MERATSRQRQLGQAIGPLGEGNNPRFFTFDRRAAPCRIDGYRIRNPGMEGQAAGSITNA
jgi:hypothetical protein